MELLDPTTEYVLLMRQLPTSTRLDNILTTENNTSIQRYTNLLTKYVIHIHEHIPESSIPIVNAKKWGSSQQLQKKLSHNLEFLNQIVSKGENEEYYSYH